VSGSTQEAIVRKSLWCHQYYDATSAYDASGYGATPSRRAILQTLVGLELYVRQTVLLVPQES